MTGVDYVGETWKREDMDSKIDKLLFRWREIESCVKERKETRHGSAGGGSRSSVSDPTAAEAIRLADELPFLRLADGTGIERPEMWLRVFTMAYWNLDTMLQDIMRRRYRLYEPYLRTSMALHISDRAYYGFVDEVRSYVVMVAVQYGLVKAV